MLTRILPLLCLFAAAPVRGASADDTTDGANHPNPCADSSAPHVAVVGEKHELHLCKDRQSAKTFGVRLASKGLGKTRTGDEKTPLGRYSLEAPRPSKRYGVFVPIGYPTAEQRKRGFTGGSVGIHGPDRRVRWLGRINNWFDTTDGCIGIATDDEMKDIAEWLRKNGARSIVIE
jgi:murein L,D-transpeptidase YafK